MKQQEAVEIIIDNDGTPTLTVLGVAGRACQDVTADIEKALGATVSDKPTADMFKRVPDARHSHKQ